LLCIPLAFLSFLGVLFSEAHLSWLGLAWLCQRATRAAPPTIRDAILLGAAGGLCFLARLDSIFLVACILLWWGTRAWPSRLLIVAVAMTAAIAAPYLIANLIYFDGFTPISGWLKSTFPSVYLKGFLPAGFASTFAGYSIVAGIIPLGLGLILTAILRPRPSVPASILYPLAAGVLAHVAYIALFTRGHTDPYWYYVQAIFFVATAIGLFAARGRSGREASNVAGMVILTAALVMCFVVRPRSIGETRQWVPAALGFMREQGIDESTMIVSDCPGKLAFHTTNRIVAVDMLTANRAFFEQMVASPNALRYLLEECTRAGKPVSHVFYLGGNTLTPVEGDSAVIYTNPRAPAEAPIGRLDRSDGLLLMRKDAGMIVWKIEPGS
ncbi:MAG TPA: hypothetical protein VNT79_10470, partial [Phycisphaerae bacterium]|nr:hypothetical protein [Phycisphaerae bacterium]